MKVEFIGVKRDNSGNKHFWGILDSEFKKNTMVTFPRNVRYFFWGRENCQIYFREAYPGLDSMVYEKKKTMIDGGYKPLTMENATKIWKDIGSELEMEIMNRVLKGDLQ